MQKQRILKNIEIFYTSTDSYDGNGNGTIHGTVSGFDSVISLKNVDLVPFKFVKNNLSIYLGETASMVKIQFLS